MLTREEEEARRQMLVRDPEYAELASAMLQRELDLSKKKDAVSGNGSNSTASS
jgi:hypothetical protein